MTHPIPTPSQMPLSDLVCMAHEMTNPRILCGTVSHTGEPGLSVVCANAFPDKADSGYSLEAVRSSVAIIRGRQPLIGYITRLPADNAEGFLLHASFLDADGNVQDEVPLNIDTHRH